MGEVYRGHDGKLGYAAAPGRRGSDAQTEAHSRARFQTSCTPLLLPYAANGPLRTCQPCKCSLCANPAALPLQHRALAGSDFLPDREYFLPYRGGFHPALSAELQPVRGGSFWRWIGERGPFYRGERD